MRNDSFSSVGNLPSVDVDVFREDVPTSTIVKKFFMTGAPLTVATIAQFSVITVTLAVIGRHLGVHELGGAALALGLLNATAFAFAAGSCGALETVLSHTYGLNQAQGGENAGTMYMYGVYTQRMAIILLAISLPLGVVVIYADVFLEYIGQSAMVVYFTGRFCRIAAFGILGTQVFQLISRYYACQHMTNPLSVAMVVASIINPILQILFIRLFGFDGSSVAWVILFTSIPLFLIWYAYRSGIYKKTWGGWDNRALKNIGSLVRLAVPSMAMMMSEWVALEVISVCAGFAEPHELVAFSISMQVFSICWGIASGIMIIVCVFIGNAIGEGKPLLGKRIANVAVGLVSVISLLNILICFQLEDYIPSFFTANDLVYPVYRRLMRFVLPYHFFDTFQSTMMGVLRGCGMQKIGAIIIGSALCLVGGPVAFLLFFYIDYGVESLWIGPFFGVVVVSVPSCIYLLWFHIDWPNLKPHQEEPPVQSGPMEVTIERAEDRLPNNREGMTVDAELSSVAPPTEKKPNT